LAERFAEFGVAGTQFLDDLFAGNRFGKNQAERILSLAAAYPRADVLSALERTVRYGAFRLAAVERILTARGRPKTPLDTLADDHRTDLDRLLAGEPTPPRPTSDYQALLGEGPDNAEPINPRPPTESSTEGPDGQDAGASPPMVTSPWRYGRWASR
jgi:hypothetical protein